MKVVLIDDERPALDELAYLLEGYHAQVAGKFLDPLEGYQFVLQEKPDVVFLDIDMPGMNGIKLGMKIQENLPGIIIVFVTAYSQYALEAFQSYPLDYILKPIEQERLLKTLQHISSRLKLSGERSKSAVHIKCFGKFEMSSGAEVVKFTTQKSRELLAYLLSRTDQAVYKDELIHCLFGTKDDKKGLNNLRVTLYRLRNTLAAYAIDKGDLLIKEDYSVAIKNGLCDFTDFCRFIRDNLIIDNSNILEAEIIIAAYKGELFSDIDALWLEEKRQWIAVRMEEMIVKAAAFRLLNGGRREAEQLLLRLIELNPLSEQGYPLLLDLYIREEDIFNFEMHYRHYARLLAELHIPVDENYCNFYSSCRSYGRRPIPKGRPSL